MVKPPRLRPSASSSLACWLPLFGRLDLGLGRGAAGASGVLMRPYHAAVHRDDLPVDVSGGLRFALEHLQDLLPDPIAPPAHQPVVAGLAGTIPFREVPPGGAGAEAPENAIDHLPVVFIRVARLSRRGGQERSEPLILGIGQVSTCHNGRMLPKWPSIVRHTLKARNRPVRRSAGTVGKGVAGSQTGENNWLNRHPGNETQTRRPPPITGVTGRSLAFRHRRYRVIDISLFPHRGGLKLEPGGV